MTARHQSISVRTRGKGTYEITDEVARIVRESGVRTGTVTVFIRHTSASLVIYENADPSARADLHAYFEKLVPEEGDYVHTLEGPDDTTSHLRMALTRTSEVIPIARRPPHPRNLAGHLRLRTPPECPSPDRRCRGPRRLKPADPTNNDRKATRPRAFHLHEMAEF